MGWQDRHYNQEYGGNTLGNPILNFLFGSVSIGRWFNIDVRIHSSLIILIVLKMLFSGGGSFGAYNAVVSSAILFAVILLHEFGHCIAARWVGGHADQIVLWPLGGLAFVHTPQRPWPSFVGTVGGPLVNLIICAITGGFLWAWSGFHYFPSLNPLLPYAVDEQLHQTRDFMVFWNSTATYYTVWVFATSWMLFVFNLLPIFPMDGGRMFQEALWPITGYRKSMSIACSVGLVGSILMAMYGMAARNLLLVFLGVSNLMTCYQMLIMMRAGAFDEPDEVDYSAAYQQAPLRKKKIKKRWFNAARKRAKLEQQEQAKIDAILAKVKEKGLHSLTWGEKRTLRKATERQRQRDLANRY
jgi:stage IV sporulation protein FB